MIRSTSHRRWIIFVLGFLGAINPLSVDLYLPAFQQIAHALQTSTASLSFTLSSYFAGIAIGQMVHGPLLDRFGRKRPLYIGLSFYIIASIGCIFSHTLFELVAWRFLTAVGGCVATVVSMAMVRDLFSTKESAKIFSLLMLVLGVSPLLAPTLGSIVTVNIGWQGVFVALIFLALLMMVLSYVVLPESHGGDASVRLTIKSIASDYWDVLIHPQFFTYAFIGAASFASLLAFIPASPVLLFTFFKVSIYQYGFLFTALAAGYISGSQASLLLLRRFHALHVLRIAIILQILFCAALIGIASIHWLHLPTLFIFLFGMLFSVGCGAPNAASLAMAPFAKNAGRASALFNTIQVLLGTLASLAIGFINIKSMLPIAVVFALPALFAGLLCYFKKYIVTTLYEEEASGAVGFH